MPTSCRSSPEVPRDSSCDGLGKRSGHSLSLHKERPMSYRNTRTQLDLGRNVSIAEPGRGRRQNHPKSPVIPCRIGRFQQNLPQISCWSVDQPQLMHLLPYGKVP